MIKRRVLFFCGLTIFLSSIFLFCGEDKRYLLFGLSIKPSPKSLSNSWVITQGGDYSIIDPITGGYETGMAYRIFEDVAEYHFKTFFNSKYNLTQFKQTAVYIGVGAGLLELLKVTKYKSDFNFYFGYQGIIGFKAGPPEGDKFCFEIQFLKSMEEGRGLQINLLTGVKF